MFMPNSNAAYGAGGSAARQRKTDFGSFFTSSSSTDQHEFSEESSLSRSVLSVRLAFMRKVYGILAAQLAFTTLVCALAMANWPHVERFMYEHTWVMMLNGLASLGVTIAMGVSKTARTNYPTNFILLGVFTLCNSISVAAFVSHYDSMLVLQAFALTTLVVGSLTLYTLQTKQELSWTGSLLYTLLTGMMFAGLANMFLRSSFVELALCVLGAACFAGYIVYDTQMIMKRVSVEEYVSAVISLYLDIVNLFIKIVKILDAIKRSNDEAQRKKQQRR